MTKDPFLQAKIVIFRAKWDEVKKPMEWKVQHSSEMPKYAGYTFALHVRVEDENIFHPRDGEYDGVFREIESRPVVKEDRSSLGKQEDESEVDSSIATLV